MSKTNTKTIKPVDIPPLAPTTTTLPTIHGDGDPLSVACAALVRINNHRKLFRQDWLPFIDAVYKLSLNAWQEADTPTELDNVSPEWTKREVQDAFAGLIKDTPLADFFFPNRRTLLGVIRKIGAERESFLQWYDEQDEDYRLSVGFPITLWTRYKVESWSGADADEAEEAAGEVEHATRATHTTTPSAKPSARSKSVNETPQPTSSVNNSHADAAIKYSRKLVALIRELKPYLKPDTPTALLEKVEKALTFTLAREGDDKPASGATQAKQPAPKLTQKAKVALKARHTKQAKAKAKRAEQPKAKAA